MPSRRVLWTMGLSGIVLAVTVGSVLARGRREPPPRPIMPVPPAEKARILAAETPEQKELRAQLEGAGRILFNTNIAGSQDIYIMNADGSNVKRLTHHPAQEYYPHLSPDGKRITFTSDQPVAREVLASLPCDPKYPISDWRKRQLPKDLVWIMNSDGSGKKPLVMGDMAHWSPDGKFIAYRITLKPRKYKLAILDLEKNTETVISHPNLKAMGMPCFSPNGKSLIISNSSQGQTIELNDDRTGIKEGSSIINVMSGHPCNAEISPDANWASYVIDTHGQLGSWLCYVALTPDERRRRKTQKFKLGWTPRSVNYFPDFSPDGKYFAYVHGETQEGVKSWLLRNRQEIYVTRFPNCETTVRLTWNGGANQHPHWVP